MKKDKKCLFTSSFGTGMITLKFNKAIHVYPFNGVETYILPI